MKRMLFTVFALSLACAGAPQGVPVADPHPTEAPVRSSPEESVAAAWAATQWGVAEASVETLPMSERAGDLIVGLTRGDKPPVSVLVRGDEVFAGREGVARWRTAANPGPGPLAVAVALVALGARGEPFGVNPKRASDYPAPTLRPDGALEFWFTEPKRASPSKAVVTFAADGALSVTTTSE